VSRNLAEFPPALAQKRVLIQLAANERVKARCVVRVEFVHGHEELFVVTAFGKVG
jgi:hypothetical protein